MDELRIFYDEVAREAYDLYEKRGRIHGYDLEDWLKAEMIVKKRYAQGAEREPGLPGRPAERRQR
jgi:hypothetical protein